MIGGNKLKIFIPGNTIAFPISRDNEIMGYSLLEGGEPLLLNDEISSALMSSTENHKEEDIMPRPLHKDIESLLILFPGGIGDVLNIKACIEHMIRCKFYPKLRHIGFVSSLHDKPLLIDGTAETANMLVYNCPIFLRKANFYDAWIAFGTLERQSLERELEDTFSEYLGIESPKKPATLIPNKLTQEVMNEYIVDNNRIKVGIGIYSASHYRSWHPATAVLTAMGLSELGCDSYILGSSTQRLQFTQNNERVSPPDHIYDMSGYMCNNEELVAFASLMDIIISADTALMHIGGCLGKPTLGLFGLTNGKYRTSYYPTVDYIQGEADCAPCLSIANLPTCNEKMCKAIMSINPEEIIAKCQQLLYDISGIKIGT